VGREAVRKRARVVVNGTDGVGDQAGHGFRVLMIPEKVRSDARGSSDRETPETDPFSVLQWSNVNADVSTSGLATLGERELVAVSGEMPQGVDRRRRPVGDDTLVGCTLPRRQVGSELEPGRPQVQVVGNRGGDHPVHAVRNPFEEPSLSGQAFQGSRPDPCLLNLTSCEKPPLLLGYLLEPWEDRKSWHTPLYP
jgi:hypothetical protein